MRKPSRRVTAAGGIAVAAAVALSAGLAMAGTSTQVTYTTAGTAAAAGWSVRSSTVDFTHTQGRYGSSGDSSWENLPVAPAGSWAAQAVTGDTIDNVQVSSTGTVTHGAYTLPPGDTASVPGVLGGIGQELCDTSQGSPGYAAQEGIVRTGPDAFDVLEVIGDFGPKALNTSGDVCDNGLIGVARGSAAIEVKILLTGVSANDTVDMNTLYNAKTHYSVFYNSHNYNVASGHVTFSADDLATGGIGFDSSIAGSFITQSFVTNEAAQGVVADTTAAVPLTGVSIPAPNGGILESVAPSELIRVAHSAASGNSVAIGGHEVQGSFFTNSAWTASAVASTADGTATGADYLIPSVDKADNFYVAGGIGLVGG